MDVLEEIQTGIKLYTLFFSTDLELPALDIFNYYKARFQIEFIFRDAKQFTGLTDCQARNKEALNFHFNISLSVLNVIKKQDRELLNMSELLF